MTGELKTLACFKNKVEIGLLWLFKSRQIVSAMIYVFAVVELLLPEAGAWSKLCQLFPEPSMFTHPLSIHTKKKEKIQQALNRNWPTQKRTRLWCAQLSPRQSQLLPLLACSMKWTVFSSLLIWPSEHFLKQYVIVLMLHRNAPSCPLAVTQAPPCLPHVGVLLCPASPLVPGCPQVSISASLSLNLRNRQPHGT